MGVLQHARVPNKGRDERRWEGETGSVAETGVVASGARVGEVVVRIDPKYFRPAEVC